jgi:hypothetical protein
LGVARLLTLLYIWSLLAVWNAPIFSIASRIIAVVSLILMSGAYEYATFMAPICSLTAWSLAKANNNVHTNFYRLLCAVAILCFIVSIFAPGNFQREAVEGASQEAFLGLPRSSFHDWGFIVLAALLSPFPAYLAVVAVWLSPSLTPILRKRLTLVLALNIAALGWFTLAVALLHAAANVPVAASGKVLPSLMMFGSYFLFFAYVCCGMIANRTRWPRTGFTPVFAILCCFLALSSNYLNVLWSLAGGSLSALASIMEQRQEIMLRNQGKDVVFPPIASCPEPVCFGEVIARRSADWPNRDIAKLYNLRSVSLLPRRFPEARAAELPGQSWRILHAGDEGSERVAVAIQRDVQSGPNAAFRDDWLVVRTSEAPSQAPVSLQAIVVADDGLLVAVLGLMKLEPPSWIWSPWLSKVVEERTIRGIEEFNRNFHGVAGTIKSFPLWQVDSQVPVSVDAQNRYAAFPLYNAGSFRSALVYLSLDGAVFYRIDVLPCERVCDKGGDTKEGVARS